MGFWPWEETWRHHHICIYEYVHTPNLFSRIVWWPEGIHFSGPGRREKSLCNGWGRNSQLSSPSEKCLKQKLNLFDSGGNKESILLCPYHALSFSIISIYLDFVGLVWGFPPLLGLYWVIFLSQKMHRIPSPTKPHGRVVMLDGPQTSPRPSTSWRLWQTNATLRHRPWGCLVMVDVKVGEIRGFYFFGLHPPKSPWIGGMVTIPTWKVYCCFTHITGICLCMFAPERRYEGFVCETKGDVHCTSTIPRASCDNQESECCVEP